MNRRQFLATAAVPAAAATGSIDLSKQCRQDFPRALNETYFNSAAQHPLGALLTLAGCAAVLFALGWWIDRPLRLERGLHVPTAPR